MNLIHFIQSIKKCESKTNYSPQAFMSFSNFPSATSRALMNFSFTIFIFWKEFALVSNAKSREGKQYILSSPPFCFSLGQSHHVLFFFSWFSLTNLKLPFHVSDNGHTLKEHLWSLEIVSYHLEIVQFMFVYRRSHTILWLTQELFFMFYTTNFHYWH